MIGYDEALSGILANARPLGTEVVPLTGLLGRVLAEPVRAPFDMPRFDNSAVDGYGVRLSDVAGATAEAPVRLAYQATVQAGNASDVAIVSGQTVKILTGAPVPSSVEAVVMQEWTEARNGHIRVMKPVKAGDNIRRRGEEFRAGEAVLPENTRVTPPVIGLLASLGIAQAVVYRQPAIAVVVTGNELRAPGEPLEAGQIYDSNSHALVAALSALGIEPVSVKAVKDTPEAIRAALSRALAVADIVISTGGVSVGEFDWVKAVLADLEVEPVFWRVAIKPGKPVFYGIHGNKQVFGLPGNPVAVLLTFYLLVRPALQCMQGLPTGQATLPNVRLLKDLRKKPERLDFVRGMLQADAGGDGLAVMPATGQGSHMLGGLAGADCLIPFAREAEAWPKDSRIPVMLLDWSKL